jgi:SAM-dependent methyltransferase
MSQATVGWDRWAKVYGSLEFLLLGRTLARTRRTTAELLPDRVQEAGEAGDGRQSDASPDPQRWLLLGCGDGRGLVQILNLRPRPMLDVVDVSPGMLRAARCRVEAQGQGGRVRWFRGDLRLGLEAAVLVPSQDESDPSGPSPPPRGDPRARYDGVVTPFFLDCFTDAELFAWWSRVAARVEIGGWWLVSDFQPPGRLRVWPGLRQRALLSLLYPAFRWTTPMRARRLPDLEAPFRRAGWIRALHRGSRSCITGTTLWRKPGELRDP